MRGGEPGDGLRVAPQPRGRIQVVQQRAHAVHQGDTLVQIGVERQMGIRRQGAYPPVAAALLLVGDHGGGDGRDGGLGAIPVDVQGEELVVEPEQIDVQPPQVVQPGAAARAARLSADHADRIVLAAARLP